jgi:transcriptional regulator with XRE-family HTH domain
MSKPVDIDPQKLMRLRTEAGLSTLELAEVSGVQRQFIVMLECGTRRYSPEVLDALCTALACKPADLLRPPELLSPAELARREHKSWYGTDKPDDPLWWCTPSVMRNRSAKQMTDRS